MKLKRYLPLFVLIMIAALGAFAIVLGRLNDLSLFMQIFMGLLFLLFSMLKLFNLSQFADGFHMYDLIGKRVRSYGYFYPFIELGLALAYFFGRGLFAIYMITIIVMVVGALGVLQALKKGLNVRCACMGNVLDVPLSTVTLTEDIGMGMMALFMLLTPV